VTVYLLDTNVCIHIRQAKPAAIARFLAIPPQDMAISLITYGELAFGAEKSPQRDRARRQLAKTIVVLQVLPMPIEAAAVYGRVRAQLAAEGRTIGNNDLWIATHALAADLVLVTGNEGEFARVPGLKLENWMQEPR
jgi:tRNA(fMet)-specific endonuclease VapC